MSDRISEKFTQKRLTDSKEADADEDVEETRYELKTEKCGILHVYVQGNIQNLTLTTPLFLTIHDIGSNHTEFHRLVEHPCMAKLKARSVWVHVELPGQEFEAPDLSDSYSFPSMQEIGEDLVHVLNFFNIKYCVVMGEGAGANIAARFVMSFPDRALGAILINFHASVAGIMQYFNEKMMSWKLNAVGMNTTAEQYLIFHKFGNQMESRSDKDKAVTEYVKNLEKRMNAKNLRLYVEAYLNRNDICQQLKEKMKVDTMLVVGTRSSHVSAVEETQSHMDPKITTMVRIDDCGDVFADAPDTFAYDMLLFCQGLGLFSALPMSRHGSICS
ncbi:uncharacterized protein B4U79_04755 [Dinothrombium tinctorium]|uniref:Uncharacterized protein n=1 Tax=Dinothrombium tinctorium TaxID=1965070 RepID=A0A443R7W4_9ACAR|nr:uncharacterized protein B4U79_04755 [Dinothrombium tinctorium]